MSIAERAGLILATFAAAVGLPVGFAVYRTWTAAHTTAALTGVLLVAGIACMAMSQAFGVALHDRRAASAPPTIHVGMPGAGGQGLDPLTYARLQELESRTRDRDQRRYLADFGMDGRAAQDAETGQFRVSQWADDPAAADMGWGE